MRRILVLTALFLASLTATADNVLNYILNTGDKTAYVTYHVDKDKNRIKYSGDIVIPDVITRDGIEYKVTEIVGSTFRDNTLVTSVVLGNNLKLIHKNAFEGCTGISEITIPASVDSIGEWAFSGSGLKSVTFEDGDNVIKLWEYAGYGIFHNNPLETVYLGRNYKSGDRPFRDFKTLKNVTVSDKVSVLQKNEFRSCRGIRKVSLGANITEIGDGAFYGCDSLVSIKLPDLVTSIGSEAFKYCDTLSSINIPSKVKIINGDAFVYCRKLQDIIIPASVDTIGGWAFSYSGLKNVTIEDGDSPLKLWEYAGYGIFHNNPLETVYLGRNYQSGDRPFRDFKTLKNVTVSDKVKTLQKNEFRSSRGIRKVSLGANITEIGDGAFYGCDSLVSIKLPDLVTSIGSEAFKYCDTLSSINIPSKVKIINGDAFEYCRKLQNITIPASVDTIGGWAFANSGLKNVTIEDGDSPLKLWEYAGYGIFHNNPLETVYLGRNYQSGDRPFRDFKTLKNVTVSDKVKALQKNEFRSSRGIRKVSLGANITEIGDGAFYGCDSLVSIKLPDLVTSIGSEAFKYCDTLSSINIPSNVKIINGDAFEYCRKLQDIVIPASVDTIGGWAFANSGLKNVTIEDGDAPLKLWEYAGYGIFHNNPLETVYLGRNYQSGDRPFRDFKTLKNVTVSDKVNALQKNEFRSSRGIRKVSLGANITEIGDGAFYSCDSLVSIKLPDLITSIGSEAFKYCDTLSSINIPSKVKIINGDAFEYCRKLQDIVIPASVDTIGGWAFANSGLKNVTIEDGDTPLKLWEYAGYGIFHNNPLETVYLGRNYICGSRPFKGYKTIKQVSIGSPVEKLQSGEFENCGNLEKIYCYRETPPSCTTASNAFKGVNKQTCILYVPEQSINLYKAADVWREFYSIVSGVKNIFSNHDVFTDGQWFDLNGRQMESSKPGLNILRTKNGKAIKVFIP